MKSINFILKIKRKVLIVIIIFANISCAYEAIDELDKNITKEVASISKNTIDPSEAYQEKFYLTAMDGDQIPVILLKPSVTGIFPCVLSIHGLTASKESSIIEDLYGKGGNLTTKLLNNGFAVAVFDVRFHGERKPQEYTSQQEHINDVLNNWSTIYPNTIDDVLIIHDYLKERMDIQADKVNLFGYSMGGMFTFTIAANYADRINAACAAVTPIFKEIEILGTPQLVAANIKNIPFLMLAATNDNNYSIQEAQWVHQLVGTSNKSLNIYGSGHDLPISYTYDVTSWFVNNR